MAQTVSKWLKSRENKRLKRCSLNTLLTTEFFRDPLRRLYYNKDVFLSPADGVVIYAYPRVGPTDKIVEVKGRNFTVQDLLFDKNYQEDSLVIGIFMSLLDVHINRMPTNGYISEVVETPSIMSHNTSMFNLEQQLFNQTRFNPDNLMYLFENERMISTITCPEIHGEYYVVQIADKDVNAIINYGEGDYFQQGERFGSIRWGSQVDVVVPLTGNIDYEILVKPFTHVQGCIDKLIRIIK